MFFVFSRVWDKEKILSPHEESSLRPSVSALQCSIIEPQRLHSRDPLHFKIGIHILHTVLCTFIKMLTRRICLTINSFFSRVIISFILVTLMCDFVMILWGEIRWWSLLGVKGLISILIYSHLFFFFRQKYHIACFSCYCPQIFQIFQLCCPSQAESRGVAQFPTKTDSSNTGHDCNTKWRQANH